MNIKYFLQSSYNQENYKEFLFSVFNFTADIASYIGVDNEKIEKYKFLGRVELDGNKDIGFFEFVSKTDTEIENNRVSLNNILKSKVNDELLDGAIAVFYNPSKPDVWRLSFIRFSYDENDKQQVTNLKRYTYVLGKKIAINTAYSQLKDLKSPKLEDIEEAFSVEKVSKEFFSEYKKLYFYICDYLKPQLALFDNENNLKLFTKKLLGRIVFLYFLEKKGWLRSDENWKNGDKNFLTKCFEKEYIEYADFYSEVLDPIFFEALNEKRENDYFAKLNCKMPFLNGGLFNKDEFDKRDIIMENDIFKKIFASFDNYNFTIIEDSPDDSEIAIDPEMLGRVFEDLLEDRKDKGAFYTPREIVHYMSKKSIENYLQTQTTRHAYNFSVEEFLEKTLLTNDEVLKFYESHPVKFVKIDNYFQTLHPYKNLVIDFYIVAKLRGLWLDKNGQRIQNVKGHKEVSSEIWHKIIRREYGVVAVNFGSNKELKQEKTTYKYPTLLKYILIEESYFVLAFMPNIFGDLELATIFPIRLKEIKRKIRKIGQNLEELSEENFAFNSEVFSKIKELKEDCRPLHTEPLSLFQVEELPRQAVIQKGLSTFYNSFKANSITSQDLKTLFESTNYYNKFINKLLSNSNTPQDELKKLMIIVLKKIKVLDPAIGSGAFPMGVLHEITSARVHLGDKTPLAKMKREIIENSIYGIDIEQSAVEIAKLRFWLSIVVDEETPTPLPNLFYKIMVGNSLVETINGFDPLAKNSTSLFDDNEFIIEDMQEKLHKYFNANDKDEKNTLQKSIEEIIDRVLDKKLQKHNDEIKSQVNNFSVMDFDNKQHKLIMKLNDEINLIEKVLKRPTTELFFYKLYFAEVMQGGGFDLVIGNPPYLRVQGIDTKTSEQYKKLFESATGSYDLYVLFVEKALSLLSPNGILNYIMPHKWINASFGKGLREISKDKVSEFISFGAYQVFNASTYTSLVWFQNRKSTKYLEYTELDKNLTTNQELEQYLFGLNENDYTKIENSELTTDVWSFTNNHTFEILEKLKKQPLKISDIFEKIFQGLKTSYDDIFILYDCVENNDLIEGTSKYLNKKITIEKKFLKPLLKGKEIHRYEILKVSKYVIYPYKVINENQKKKAVLYNENEIKLNFPLGYKFLKECEAPLRNREKGRLKDDDFWFRYIYPKNLLLFDKEKLVVSEITLGSNITFDTNKIYHVGQYSMIKYSHIKESYKFYLAILNSKLLWYFIKNTGSVLRGGYFTYRPDYLNPFPIPKIDNLQDTKPYEDLVDEIMKLKEQGEETKHLEDTIDKMVYALYGLSDDEIKVIEKNA